MDWICVYQMLMMHQDMGAADTGKY